MSWEPINTAPKDGSLIVCWAKDKSFDYGWDGPRFLCWKFNHRTGLSYFGHPVEYDDYELAEDGNGPTHWHPLDPTPAGPE